MKKTLFFIFAMVLAIGANAQWIVQSTNFPDESTGIRNISIANDDVVWVASYDGSGNNVNLRTISKTTDGGDNWAASLVSAIPNNCDIAMIHAIDANNAWIASNPTGANGAGQGIYHTSDGGTTWARQESAVFTASGAFANVVWMDAQGNGFCQGDPTDGYFELYTTTDFGENWVRVPQANIPAHLSGEFGYTGQIYTAGNTIWFSTNKGRIYRSADKGLNWEVFQSPINDFGGANMSGTLTFSDNNNGLLLNKNGNVWKTEDGAETWTAITDAPFSADIALVPGTGFAVVTGSAQEASGSAWTEDGGMTWHINLEDNAQHTDMAFNENHEGWSGGFSSLDNGGGIYKYVGTFLSVDEAAAAQNIACFPNPTNDLLQVQAQSQIQEVRIVNFLGQEIERIAGGANYMTLDLSDMQSGIYFVEVNAVNGKQTVKVVKR